MTNFHPKIPPLKDGRMKKKYLEFLLAAVGGEILWPSIKSGLESAFVNKVLMKHSRSHLWGVAWGCFPTTTVELAGQEDSRESKRL